MELISSLLNGLDDISDLVPPLDSFLGSIAFWLRLFLLAGPVLLLVLGIWYLKSPPKEANHIAGFRTYYGMGSVEAWQYTQQLAGTVFRALGAVLLAVTVIVCLVTRDKDGMELAQAAFIWLCIQAVLAIAGYLFICIQAAKHFDKYGNPKM